MQHIGCDRSCYDSDAAGNGGTRKARIRLHRKDLLYDIKNYAYIEGHVMGEENQHAQHTLVDIGEEGNIDRVNRLLDVAHALAIEMLYPYTKQEPLEEEEICDRMFAPKDYCIEMEIPASMSRTTLHLLTKLIHEFMVAQALGDWLSITHPEAAGNWLGKAQAAKEEIESIKHTRTGMLRRPSYPF